MASTSYDIVLNLDIINFQNIEILIKELVGAIKITSVTLDLDKENFTCLLELNMKGSSKSWIGCYRRGYQSRNP